MTTPRPVISGYIRREICHGVCQVVVVYARSPAEPGGAVAREADGAGDAAVGSEGGGRSRGAPGRAGAGGRRPAHRPRKQPASTRTVQTTPKRATRDTPETANQITDAALVRHHAQPALDPRTGTQRRTRLRPAAGACGTRYPPTWEHAPSAVASCYETHSVTRLASYSGHAQMIAKPAILIRCCRTFPFMRIAARASAL